MTNIPCVFELDDFETDEVCLHALSALKAKNKDFKATLFVVVGKCELSKLADISKCEWIELAVHGLSHRNEYNWTYAQTIAFFQYIDRLGIFSRLFKMPWNLTPSEGFMQALYEFKYRYCTLRRDQLPELQHYKIPTYLGAPFSKWLHPFQLYEHITIEPYKNMDFYTISELFNEFEGADFLWTP